MRDHTAGSARSPEPQPLLFISHRHADKPIADVLRHFVTDKSGGRIRVFQSSAAEAENPRVGRELHRELIEHLWEAGVIVLVYTSPEEDWSYCMWECGVATHPGSPETKILVLQCASRPPAVYTDAVRVSAQDPVSVAKFTNDFLTSADFFPDSGEAVAPGFFPNGDEVQQAAAQLYAALRDVIPNVDGGEDWSTLPFLRLQLSYAEVDRVREMDPPDGARAVLQDARVKDIDGEAKRLFGLGRVEPMSLFSDLVSAWEQSRPGDSTRWKDELVEQLRVGSHWKYPRFSWQLMSSADDSDRARYAPVLSRVRSVPRDRCHEFDIYFSKFDTDDEGALRVGFNEERQARPGDVPAIA